MSGCVTIPPEAPSLSSELDRRISALENANVTLLNCQFDQKRMEVDRFIQDVWLPEFASEFFQKPFIGKATGIKTPLLLSVLGFHSKCITKGRCINPFLVNFVNCNIRGYVVVK